MSRLHESIELFFKLMILSLYKMKVSLNSMIISRYNLKVFT